MYCCPKHFSDTKLSYNIFAKIETDWYTPGGGGGTRYIFGWGGAAWPLIL